MSIKKVTKEELKIKTPQEKLIKMNEKNKKLLVLIKTFNLEII